MATILIVSEGSGVPTAMRLAKEGHVVRIYFTNKDAGSSLKGLKNPLKVTMIPSNLESFDMILFDGYKEGKLAEQFRDKDKAVIGGGIFNDKLELNREYGEKVVSTLMPNVSLPKSESCKTSSEAIKYLESVGKAQVLKPFNNRPTYFLPISETDDNEVLVQLVKGMPQDLIPCLIQEKVKGVEVSTEGWFDGASFTHFNHTLEKKRMLDGDRGCLLGCAGNVVWSTEGDKLTDYCLTPLTALLQKVDYLGPIDVNMIVTEDKCYFLEFTPRFGHDAIQTLMELMRKPLFDYFWNLQMKKNLPAFKQEYAIGVRLSFPPYPFGREIKGYFKQLEGLKVLDVPPEAESHVHYYDVKFENGKPQLAGVDGALGCATARGETIRECRRRVYRTINNICKSKDIQYRSDIGEGMDKDIEQLKTWGWLNA